MQRKPLRNNLLGKFEEIGGVIKYSVFTGYVYICNPGQKI